ncbi:MAG TPA: hypothetical protein PKD53_03095, partial [Chloroflexaceae bacterium]|nr:hypothetical protein [Chloroflexaceae bacterium]
AMVDSFIDDMQRRAQAEIDKWTAELRRRAVEEFWRAVCGVVPATTFAGTGLAYWRLRRRQRGGGEA